MVYAVATLPIQHFRRLVGNETSGDPKSKHPTFQMTVLFNIMHKHNRVTHNNLQFASVAVIIIVHSIRFWIERAHQKYSNCKIPLKLAFDLRFWLHLTQRWAAIARQPTKIARKKYKMAFKCKFKSSFLFAQSFLFFCSVLHSWHLYFFMWHRCGLVNCSFTHWTLV